jgi:hypothetical protein
VAWRCSALALTPLPEIAKESSLAGACAGVCTSCRTDHITHYSATTNQITGKKTKVCALSHHYAMSGLLTDAISRQEVVVQGHLSQEMKEWLHVRYGLPERLVDIEIRKGVKPKKKAR